MNLRTSRPFRPLAITVAALSRFVTLSRQKCNRVLSVPTAISLSLLSAVSGRAATYYMAPGGSDSASGTINAPWATLGKAAGTMVSGDVLYIRGGVYDADPSNAPNQQFDASGKSNLVISNYPGETPVFKNQRRGGGPIALFTGSNYRNVTISGLTSTNHDCFLYWTYSTKCTISYCNVGPAFPSTQGVLGRPPCYSVCLFYNSQSNHIHHNVFHDMQSSWADGAQHDAGGVLQIGADPDSPSDKSEYNLIENNTNYHGGHDVLLIQAAHNIIRSNYFYNDAFYYVPASPTYAGHRCIGIEAPFTIVEYNRSAYSSFPFFNDGAECLTIETPTNIIRGNEFIWGYNAGIDIYYKGSWTITENHVYNNTLAWNGLSPKSLAGYGEEDKRAIRTVGTVNPIHTYFVNNLLAYNSYYNGANTYSNGNDLTANNYWLNNWSNNAAGAGDPKFTKVPTTYTTLLDGVKVLGRPDHPEDIDLQLQASSPCIDGGSFLTTITSASGSGTTFNVADTRYFFDGYGMVQGDTIQVQGQSTTATIIACNWAGSSITVDRPLTWTNGQGVALAYNGKGPDYGAHEFGLGSTNPLIMVTPSRMDIGFVSFGVTTNVTLAVQNTGGGTLSGVASTAPPFSIVAGGTYSLGSGQSQPVVVSYTAPLTRSTNTQSVTFTGGNGFIVPISAIASVLPPVISGITQSGADVDIATPGIQVVAGSAEQYFGSASDPASLPLTWQWLFRVNGGPETVLLSGSGSVGAASYTYPGNSAGNAYVWILRVSNGSVTSESNLAVQVVATPPSSLTFQAGDGTITAPFVLANGYISQPDQTTDPAAGGIATYTFTLTNAGSFVIRAMVNAADASANSLFVNIDAMPQDPTMIWDIPITSGFEQRDVSWRGNGTPDANEFVPKIFTLSQGTHQLIIVGREAEAQLQSFSIVQVVGLAPPQNLRIVSGQ